jgi:hypothetical protein
MLKRCIERLIKSQDKEVILKTSKEASGSHLRDVKWYKGRFGVWMYETTSQEEVETGRIISH